MTVLLILSTSLETDDFVIEDVVPLAGFEMSGVVAKASDCLLLIWFVVEEVVPDSVTLCISADVFVELLEMMRSPFS